MVKKNKKSKKSQETSYEEKPKTKREYVTDLTSDVTPSKEDGRSVTYNTKLTSDDLKVETNNEENLQEVAEMQIESANSAEDFVEVKQERPMHSKSKHGRFQNANHLLGTSDSKKGTDFKIPNSSRGNTSRSADYHHKERDEHKHHSSNETYNKKSRESHSSRDSGNDVHWEQTQFTRNNEKKSGNSNSRSSSNERSFSKSAPIVDKRYDDWLKFEANLKFCKDPKYSNVTETFGDLFTAPEEYSLGHCVAEDMNMGSGIATTFRSKFKRVAELLDQRQSQGGLAILEDKGRFIYYLVTKPYSSGKPTYETLFRSLVKMRDHVTKNNVKKVALPQIGCGLDNLEWSRVKPLLQFLFDDVDVEIKIYNFQKDPYTHTASTSKQTKCRVVNVLKPVKEIDDYTIIIYPCTVEKFESDVMIDLDEKFRVLKDYHNSNRRLGTVIQTKSYKGDYILYGVVVKDKKNDKIDYKHFQTCLYQINKDNKKELFNYVAIQAFVERSDDKVMTKLVNLMRNTLIQVEVYVCWPKDLECYAPSEAFYN